MPSFTKAALAVDRHIGGLKKYIMKEPKIKSYIIIELFLEINLGIGSRASESGGGK